MDVFDYLRKKIIKHLDLLAKENNFSISNYSNFSISTIKNKDLGEISTNVAFVYCNFFNLSSYKFATRLITSLKEDKDIKSSSIAKNGFINFVLKESFWHSILIKILRLEDHFSLKNSMKYKNLIYKQSNINFNDDINSFDDLSSQNLAFYLPYTYAKICSIITNSLEVIPQADLMCFIQKQNFTLLNNEDDLYMIRTLALWPKILEEITIYHDSDKIIIYLKNIADYFHDSLKKNRIYYNKYVSNNNSELIIARCSLALAIKTIITNAFMILNINTIEKI